MARANQFENMEANDGLDKQSSGRRSELEVKMDILRVTNEGSSKPTQIMYKANLSWLSLLSHLESLTDLGFLKRSEVASRKVYEITPEGLDLLHSYERVVSALREVPSRRYGPMQATL